MLHGSPPAATRPGPRQWKGNASTHAGMTVLEHTLLRAATESQGDSSEQSQQLPVERSDPEPDGDVDQGGHEPDPPPRLQVRVPGPVIDGGRTRAVVGEARIQVREEGQT